MNSTASDLPRLLSNPSDAQSSKFEEGSYIFEPYEALTGLMIAGPGTEHWALLAWLRESAPVWVNLDATGMTSMDPAAYRYVTTHHFDMVGWPIELLETMDELDDLRGLPSGWNGYDVAAPSRTAIQAAIPWVQMYYSEAMEETGRWIEPHVTADETGEVMFEWSNEDKALTAYVSEDEVTLARDWGPDIETEMESVVNPQTELRREWWAWLAG